MKHIVFQFGDMISESHSNVSSTLLIAHPGLPVLAATATAKKVEMDIKEQTEAI